MHYWITHWLWWHARCEEHKTSLYLCKKQFHICSINYEDWEKYLPKRTAGNVAWNVAVACHSSLLERPIDGQKYRWALLGVTIGLRGTDACPGTNNSFLHRGITKRMNEDPKISETSTHPPAKYPTPHPPRHTHYKLNPLLGSSCRRHTAGSRLWPGRQLSLNSKLLKEEKCNSFLGAN